MPTGRRAEHKPLGDDLGPAVGVPGQSSGVGQGLIPVHDGLAALHHHIQCAGVHQAADAQLQTGIDDPAVSSHVDLFVDPGGDASIPDRGGRLKHHLDISTGSPEIFSIADISLNELADRFGKRLEIQNAHLFALIDQLAHDFESQHARAADDQTAIEGPFKI
jgi:hypothetical protein